MFKISPLKTATLTATGLFLGISAASAALVPGVEWTTDGPSSVGSLNMGYEFHVNSNVSVRGLGIYALGGSLTESHDVGLWDIGGTLLASTTVTPTDTLIGHFRYKTIPNVTLLAGNDYVVGAQTGSDAWSFDNTGFTVDSSITYTQDRFDSFGASLSFPDLTTFRTGTDSSNGFFGGNILLSTPEGSATFLMTGLGMAACVGFGWRKRAFSK